MKYYKKINIKSNFEAVNCCKKWKIINLFGGIEIEKQQFHQHKRPISVVSNEFPFGKKCFRYFTGYKNAKKFKHLCIFLPKTSAYRRSLIKDPALLEKFNEIWDKVKSGIKKQFDIEPVYNEKYLNA